MNNEHGDYKFDSPYCCADCSCLYRAKTARSGTKAKRQNTDIQNSDDESHFWMDK